MTAISVDTIHKNHNSGNFTVSGCINWLGEPVKPQHATKMVRQAELTDSSGTINLSVCDNHIQQFQDKQFYTVTNCKLKHYFGKRLANTVNTAGYLKMLNNHRTGCAVQKSWTFIHPFIQCAITKSVTKKLVNILGQKLFVDYIATEQCFLRTVIVR